jgi:HSP20 family molecular chaperone IbpA
MFYSSYLDSFLGRSLYHKNFERLENLPQVGWFLLETQNKATPTRQKLHTLQSPQIESGVLKYTVLVPGVEKESVKVKVTTDKTGLHTLHLTVVEADSNGEERSWKSSRTITESCEMDLLVATMKNGILTIQIPLKEEQDLTNELEFEVL